MTQTKTVYTAAENAHHYALVATRNAIRAGDIVLAERWMRLCDYHWRCCERAERAALRRRERLRLEAERAATPSRR